MSLRSGLQQTLTQKTTLTLVQRQSVELLQLNVADLQAAVEEALATNPLLEAADPAPESEPAAPVSEPEAGVARTDDREPALLSWARSPQTEEATDPLERISASQSLTEHLLDQAGCLPLSATDAALVHWIIGNLDEQGFLSDSLEQCAQDCPVAAEPEAWRAALALVQSFEPAGVGAANAIESLLVQLRRKAASRPEMAATARLAQALLMHARASLAKRDFKAAARALQADVQEVTEAFALLTTLNPHPAAAFADALAAYSVVPDVLVRKHSSIWRVELNPAVAAHVRFDHASFELLKSAKLSGEDLAAWKEHAGAAKNFVRALEQRYATIVAVAETIVRLQSAFFEHGPSALMPMGLKDVASQLNMAESTISRSCAGKYMQTPMGTFEFKAFFSSAVAGSDGQAVSSAAVRRRIVELVAAEDPTHPLSDAAIAQCLEREGITVARRTVAKYRELEQIAPKSLRKILATAVPKN